MTTTANPNDCGQSTDTDELWQRVQYTLQDIPRGFLVLRDSPISYLLVATDRITGIECPQLWTSAPNYWYYAWEVANRYLGQVSKLGMAVNAKFKRGHEQLHIHVSCIRKEVQDILQQNDKNITKNPKTWDSILLIPSPTIKANYRVLLLDTNVALARNNLFRLLYDVVGKDPDMQYQTLVVAKRPQSLGEGFYILNSDTITSSLNPGTGHGEDLLDYKCS